MVEGEIQEDEFGQFKDKYLMMGIDTGASDKGKAAEGIVLIRVM